MTIHFTATEIKSAVKHLKNNKSPGNDEIPIELIKFAPDAIHDQISTYNILYRLSRHFKWLSLQKLDSFKAVVSVNLLYFMSVKTHVICNMSVIAKGYSGLTHSIG